MPLGQAAHPEQALWCRRLSDDLSGVSLGPLDLGDPGPGEVRLRVRAAALNFPDLLMTRGLYQFKPELPFVMGLEGCGIVQTIGKDVHDFNPGDRVAFSYRQGAAAVVQFELMPMPPEQEDKPLTWPYWPQKLRTSSSHEEGVERDWAVATKRFIDDGKGSVKALVASRVQWERDPDSGQMRMQEVPGSEFEIKADLVLLAMGFVSPVASILDAFAVAKDGRGNALAASEGEMAYRTNVDKVFAAGDVRRGQSLVVWAIREGRQVAHAVDSYLMGTSELPR